MAFTKSFVTDSVMGKYRIRVNDVTADATTGNVDTGLKRVTWAMVTGKVSVCTSPNFFENVLAEATAAAGWIGLSNCVSGDTFRVVSFGPS